MIVPGGRRTGQPVQGLDPIDFGTVLRRVLEVFRQLNTLDFGERGPGWLDNSFIGNGGFAVSIDISRPGSRLALVMFGMQSFLWLQAQTLDISPTTPSQTCGIMLSRGGVRGDCGGRG